MFFCSRITSFSKVIVRKMSARVLQGPELTYNIKETTMGTFFFENAEKYSDRVCQIDANIDKSETFGSFKKRSVRVAIALQKQGITSKDVIQFCARNSLDNGVAMIAAFYLGAKVINLDTMFGVEGTKYLISLAAGRIIFVEETAVPVIEKSLTGTKLQPEIIVFGQSTKYQKFSDLVKPQPNEDEFRPAKVDPDDIIYIVFSSGSTGQPKPVCHSHAAFFAHTKQCCQVLGELSIYHFSSFYWVSSMSITTYLFQVGQFRVFSYPGAEMFFKVLDKYKVSCACIPPFFSYYLTNYKDKEKYNTSSLKMLVVSGNPIASNQVNNLSDLFKSATVFLLYGMSEVCVVFYEPCHKKKPAQAKPSFHGQLYPGINLKVVNPDTGKLLGPKELGEIRIKSSSVMKGYHNSDSTKYFDNEGFFKTEDVGYYDDNNKVQFFDRKKLLIKYKDYLMAPTMLETVLTDHPAVKEAAVVGIPREEVGEVPAASVVLKEGLEVSKEEIQRFFDENVLEYEKLRGGIKFVKELPKTPTGKFRRKVLRESFLGTHKSNNQ